jgi:hypothetical protein
VYLLTVVFWLAALLSKEIAAMYPVVLMLWPVCLADCRRSSVSGCGGEPLLSSPLSCCARPWRRVRAARASWRPYREMEFHAQRGMSSAGA